MIFHFCAVGYLPKRRMSLFFQEFWDFNSYFPSIETESSLYDALMKFLRERAFVHLKLQEDFTSYLHTQHKTNFIFSAKDGKYLEERICKVLHCLLMKL